MRIHVTTLSRGLKRNRNNFIVVVPLTRGSGGLRGHGFGGDLCLSTKLAVRPFDHRIMRPSNTPIANATPNACQGRSRITVRPS